MVRKAKSVTWWDASARPRRRNRARRRWRDRALRICSARSSAAWICSVMVSRSPRLQPRAVLGPDRIAPARGRAALRLVASRREARRSRGLGRAETAGAEPQSLAPPAPEQRRQRGKRQRLGEGAAVHDGALRPVVAVVEVGQRERHEREQEDRADPVERVERRQIEEDHLDDRQSATASPATRAGCSDSRKPSVTSAGGKEQPPGAHRQPEARPARLALTDCGARSTAGARRSRRTAPCAPATTQSPARIEPGVLPPASTARAVRRTRT